MGEVQLPRLSGLFEAHVSSWEHIDEVQIVDGSAPSGHVEVTQSSSMGCLSSLIAPNWVNLEYRPMGPHR